MQKMGIIITLGMHFIRIVCDEAEARQDKLNNVFLLSKKVREIEKELQRERERESRVEKKERKEKKDRCEVCVIYIYIYIYIRASRKTKSSA